MVEQARSDVRLALTNVSKPHRSRMRFVFEASLSEFEATYDSSGIRSAFPRRHALLGIDPETLTRVWSHPMTSNPSNFHAMGVVRQRLVR